MEKFETKKSLGQHFLNSPVVPRFLVEAGLVTATDTVVEIGPGTGALTAELLKQGATVVALEADQRAIAVLQEKFAADVEKNKLKILHADARDLELESLGLKNHTFKVVANIPYYLTGHLFRVFLESVIQPNLLVFLVQKEVGKRATSSLTRGEKESLLSLSIKAFGTPEYIRTIGKGHFTPAPKVDSAIVRIQHINRDQFQDLSTAAFFQVLHLGFGSKRKQLVGNLSKKYAREDVVAILKSLDLPTNVRAEDIGIEKWVKIAKKLT